MSRPASACGIDARCTFVMDVNLALVSPSRVAALIGSSENKLFLEKLASWPRSGVSASILALSASISLMSRLYSGTTGFFRPPLFLRPARPSTSPPPPPPWRLFFLCDDGIVTTRKNKKETGKGYAESALSKISKVTTTSETVLLFSIHTQFAPLVDVDQIRSCSPWMRCTNSNKITHKRKHNIL